MSRISLWERVTGVTLFGRAPEAIFAAIGLLAMSPFLLLAALAISIESRGGVLHRDRRIGKDGREFDMWRLRTTFRTAEQSRPGLTGVGRVLRETSLDYVPLLINVVRGDMALVGPRPDPPLIAEHYTELERGRLAVKPGFAGWEQINHYLSPLPEAERYELDLWYIEHRSWRLHLKILALSTTLPIRKPIVRPLAD